MACLILQDKKQAVSVRVGRPCPMRTHHHVHEEMIVIREGTLAVTISGKTSELGPGSVAFVASNEEHGWRNIGKSRARYMVMALGMET